MHSLLFRSAGVWLLVALCIVQVGCVRRRMTIRSTPPGAKVYIDDMDIGVTPVSTNFTYYASRKITLIKDGFRTETKYERVLPPWYEIPPLDFISENFTVRELRDERVLDFQLIPQEIVPQERLLGRAEDLRFNARQGIITPLLPGSTNPLPAVQTGPPVSLPGEGLPENAPILYDGLQPAAN
jgi:hypothetical protein